MASILGAGPAIAPAATRPAGDPMPLASAAFTQTATIDFLAGVHDGTAVGELDSSAAGGRIHLAAPLSDLFVTSTLDPLWHVTRPSAASCR